MCVCVPWLCVCPRDDGWGGRVKRPPGGAARLFCMHDLRMISESAGRMGSGALMQVGRAAHDARADAMLDEGQRGALHQQPWQLVRRADGEPRRST